MKISKPYDALTDIPVEEKMQCLRGTWNQLSRVLIVKVDTKYQVVVANMLDRFVAVLLNIIQVDYFKLRLKGKEVRVLSPDELNSTDNKIANLVNPRTVSTICTKGYELGKEGVLYQVKPNGNLQEASPDKFRPCHSQGNLAPLNLMIQAQDKKISLAFSTTPGADQIDIVLNERFLCFYTKGRLEECFAQIEWKSCFDKGQEPSYADFKKLMTSAQVKFEFGIFTFFSHKQVILRQH